MWVWISVCQLECTRNTAVSSVVINFLILTTHPTNLTEYSVTGMFGYSIFKLCCARVPEIAVVMRKRVKGLCPLPWHGECSQALVQGQGNCVVKGISCTAAYGPAFWPMKPLVLRICYITEVLQEQRAQSCLNWPIGFSLEGISLFSLEEAPASPLLSKIALDSLLAGSPAGSVCSQQRCVYFLRTWNTEHIINLEVSKRGKKILWVNILKISSGK